MLKGLLYKPFHVLTVMGEVGWPAKLLAVGLAFVAPLNTMFTCMILFIVLDTVAAIYNDYKTVIRMRSKQLDDLNGTVRKMTCLQILWRMIDPDKLRRTAEKLFAYPVVITACYVFDYYVLCLDPGTNGAIGKWSLTNVSFILIVFSDFKSFLRNMGRATGNKIYTDIEYWLMKVWRKGKSST